VRHGVALVAALALALAGCGEDDQLAVGEATELSIVLDRDGDGGAPSQRAALSCPRDGPEVCELVAALPSDPGAPVPPGTPCTEIYGGPDTVAIEGTIEGESVEAELTRDNGCEIDRFDRFTPLLRELFGDYQPGEALAP
jgi:hypothetical protein